MKTDPNLTQEQLNRREARKAALLKQGRGMVTLNEMRDALNLLDQLDDKLDCLEASVYERLSGDLTKVRRSLVTIVADIESRHLKRLKENDPNRTI